MSLEVIAILHVRGLKLLSFYSLIHNMLAIDHPPDHSALIKVVILGYLLETSLNR